VPIFWLDVILLKSSVVRHGGIFRPDADRNFRPGRNFRARCKPKFPAMAEFSAMETTRISILGTLSAAPSLNKYVHNSHEPRLVLVYTACLCFDLCVYSSCAIHLSLITDSSHPRRRARKDRSSEYASQSAPRKSATMQRKGKDTRINYKDMYSIDYALAEELVRG
jgi:hypothetical protein